MGNGLSDDAERARASARERFVTDAGWPLSAMTPLDGDASTRRYFRLLDGGRKAILMDAPPGAEGAPCPPDATPDLRETLGYNAVARLAGPDCRPFGALSAWLRTQNLNAPEILDADYDQGFLLLEDLGDDLFATVIAGGGPEWPLYEAAIEVLTVLHRSKPPRTLPVTGGRALPLLDYDPVALLAEIDLFSDWYLPAILGKTDKALKQEFRDVWSRILARETPDTSVLVLRDYHAENLLWMPDREGVMRVGLLDFQDGLRGAPAYDVASLITDARRDVAPALAKDLLAHYIDRRTSGGGAFDPVSFQAQVALLGVQRTIKILGIFARLCFRDGKPRYLGYVPRLWGYLDEGLSHPLLEPVAQWLDTHVPRENRNSISDGAGFGGHVPAAAAGT